MSQKKIIKIKEKLMIIKNLNMKRNLKIFMNYIWKKLNHMNQILIKWIKKE